MRCVGIDIAKTGWAGMALVVDGECVKSIVWRPENPKASAADILLQKFRWHNLWLATFAPDVVAVEELQVFQNKKVIRALSNHEGIALLSAKLSGAIVL